MHFRFLTKGSHENTNFDILKCSDENLPNCSCHFPNHSTSQFSFKFYMTLQCHEIYSSVIFLGQILYALRERDQSKCRFFRLFSVRIKIHQILVIFEAKKKFLFKFCTTLWYHEMQLVHTFFTETLYTFSKNSLSKYKFVEISPEQSKV